MAKLEGFGAECLQFLERGSRRLAVGRFEAHSGKRVYSGSSPGLRLLATFQARRQDFIA